MPADDQTTLAIVADRQTRQDKEIEKVKQEMNGLPQRILNFEEKLGEIALSIQENNKTVLKKLEDLEEKFQTREMCKLCMDGQNLHITNLGEKSRGLEAKVDDFEKERNALKNKVLFLVIGYLAQLIAWLALNHDKFSKGG